MFVMFKTREYVAVGWKADLGWFGEGEVVGCDGESILTMPVAVGKVK